MPKFNMGGFGGANMQNLMRQAQKMQEDMQTQLKEADEKLSQTEISTTAGGGMITAVVTGNGQIKSIKINPEAVDPNDTDMLEDLIIACVNEGLTKAHTMEKELKKSINGGLMG